jgi:NitT/TauT family transport system ATP-binding protein
MMTDPSPFLDFKQVSFAYPGEPPIFEHLTLSLAPGDFHCLVGRSGCGKTTLLKCAAGLLQPTSGSVQIDAKSLNGPSRQVGFVFQTPSLLEWRTVLDNVLLPIALHRRITRVDRERAGALLAQMGIADHADRYPQYLSGGQQSRVALARALVTDPPALCMDEPFAALDAITREELQNDLRQLTRSNGTTVLFVTHDIAEAVSLASHVSIMNAGQITSGLQVDLPTLPGTDALYATQAAALRQEIRGALMHTPQAAET